jgi:threonine/homoserine/homoserine lactone efflux protein
MALFVWAPAILLGVVVSIVGGVVGAVEILEGRRARRWARRRARRGFRPVVIQGGRGQAPAAGEKLAG